MAASEPATVNSARRNHGLSILVVIAFVSVLVVGSVSVAAENLGSTWTSGLAYPFANELSSCLPNTDFGYVYCIGGFDGLSYHGDVEYSTLPLTSGGVWFSTVEYPVVGGGMSCFVYAVFIYCVGGFSGHTGTDAVYYSQPTSTGTGSWINTTPYPIGIELESCSPYSGYVYCVGGYNGRSYLNSSYYSKLYPAGGDGSWANGTEYPSPVEGQSCLAYSGYMYCIGGYNGSNAINNVYYAPLSTAGIGAWKNTTSYPNNIYGQSCAIASGYVYCVGGYANAGYTSAVYYASLQSTGGLGVWTAATRYPVAIGLQSCFVYSSSLYCIGGFDGTNVKNTVYSDSISPQAPVTTTSTITTTVTSNGTSTIVAASVSTINQTVTTTETSTASTTVLLPTTITTTALSFSAFLTSTVTSTVKAPGGSTITATTTTTVVETPAGAASSPALFEIGAAAAGLVAGVLVAAGMARIRGRSKNKSAESQSP